MKIIQDSNEASIHLGTSLDAILSFKFIYLNKIGDQLESFSIPGGRDKEAYNALKSEHSDIFVLDGLDSYPWEIRIDDVIILFYHHEDGPTIHGRKVAATEIISLGEEFRKWLEKWLRGALNMPSALVRIDVS